MISTHRTPLRHSSSAFIHFSVAIVCGLIAQTLSMPGRMYSAWVCMLSFGFLIGEAVCFRIAWSWWEHVLVPVNEVEWSTFPFNCNNTNLNRWNLYDTMHRSRHWQSTCARSHSICLLGNIILFSIITIYWSVIIGAKVIRNERIYSCIFQFAFHLDKCMFSILVNVVHSWRLFSAYIYMDFSMGRTQWRYPISRWLAKHDVVPAANLSYK